MSQSKYDDLEKKNPAINIDWLHEKNLNQKNQVGRYLSNSALAFKVVLEEKLSPAE